MKRAIIVHGWDGFPEEAWFYWLKRELETRGFSVEVPQMPEASAPKIEPWVSALSEVVGVPDNELILIGHSIGVQTILRYLEAIDVQIKGVLSVAGFFTLIPGSIGTTNDEAVAEPWLTTSINADKVKAHAEKIIAIFSDDDPYVSLENAKTFASRLHAETIVLTDRGHMGNSEQTRELPEALEAVLKFNK